MNELINMIKIYIIESPSSIDVLDGRKECEALSNMLNLAGIKNQSFGVTDIETLKLAFHRITLDVLALESQLGAVYLHFSMHGCNEGMALTNNSFIDWKLFYTLIKEFNDTIGYVNPGGEQKIAPTFLAFSVCEGFNARIIKDYGEESPYTALIGPTRPVEWSDSLLAFSIYYHNIILKKIGADSAIKNMNYVIGSDDLFQADFGKGMERINIMTK